MKLGKLSVVISGLVLAAIAKAEVLLVVDLSNPSATIISATSGLASASSSTSASQGVFLQHFFTDAAANVYFPQEIGGDLAPAFPSSQVVGDTLLSIQTESRAFNYYALNAGDNWSFTSGSQAFAGSTTAFNLSSVLTYLPGGGATGDILDMNSVVIGQWQAVVGAPIPEPASFGLIAGMVLGGFAFSRRSPRGGVKRTAV